MRSRRYGSSQMAARTSEKARAGQRREARADDDEDRGEHDRDGDGRPQVRLDQDERDSGAEHDPDRADELTERARRRRAREVRRDPERQRELRELRGLDGRRADGEPALGSVHRRADDEHGDEQDEAREQERGNEVAQAAVVRPGEGDEGDDAEQRVDGLALEVVGGIVRGERGSRRACAVDHDEAERDEAERHDDEQVVLEAAAGWPLHSPSTSWRKRAPRSSKLSNWS